MSDARGNEELPTHWSATTRSDWLRPAGIIVTAIAILIMLGLAEASWLADVPWARAIRTLDTPLDAPDAIEAWTRKLPVDESLSTGGLSRQLQEDLLEIEREARAAGLPTSVSLEHFPRIHLLMADVPADAQSTLLASGRYPVPGKREVLAGPLLPDSPVVIDGETFEVTGRIRREAAGFIKTYLVPRSPEAEAHISPDRGATRGSLIIEPGDRMESLLPALFDENRDGDPEVAGGAVYTRPGIAWMTWFCLVAVAFGACALYRELGRFLARKPIPFLGTAMREVVLHDRLFVAMHAVFFGGFFGTMAWGLLDPELNFFFIQYVSHEFTEGGLRHVGEAYDSGNIPKAFWATFYNNFVIQTILLTTSLSIIPPFLGGILKVFASLALVGFAMAPAWSGTAMGMSYHALTLGLELPPYVMVAVGAALWAWFTWRLILAPLKVWYLGPHAAGRPIVAEAVAEFPRGAIVLAGTTLISAVYLFVAAWYEAVTLILLR